MKNACFVTQHGERAIDYAYSQEIQANLHAKLNFLPPIHGDNVPTKAHQDCHFIFSTWGCPAWDEDFLAEHFPQLEALFYAAGSVQAFGRSYLNRGVRIFAAPSTNAIPVADYCLAQIILASKGYFTLARQRSNMTMEEAVNLGRNYMGSYGMRIGLIGFGQIARLLTKKIHQVLALAEVSVYDPYVSREELETYGAKPADLDLIFSSSEVVSNHLPNLPTTQAMLNREHFEKMPKYATFINTGRGAQVVEDDLAEILRERPDLTALLDVTFPEPPQEGHPFYHLPNLFLTPHIAGSSGREVQRMGAAVFDAFEKYEQDLNSDMEVRIEDLEKMA